ncbi:glycosyltransferase [Larkinella knui]|uniref:Glycosyltransferase n=1 Tax=Larkinella knui TaxID=2025310 RepID=A0A3P1CUE6_9BACT|nr:glycosyltransferase [Larkinella knui]RRB16937.1 glycosyltransferase [Larkinella knui]
MRILHICAYTWSIGGPARMIYDHTQIAVAAGHQVDILSPMSPNDQLYPAPEGSRVIPCLRTPVISRFFREVSLDLYRYLKAHSSDYDIIHCHGLWHFGSIAPFLVNKTVPKVITVHGVLDAWALRQSRWKKQLMDFLVQKKFMAQADLIHILNEDERQDVERYLGYQHPRIVLIPNGIRVSDFSNLPPRGQFRNEFNLDAGQRMVLFMSRLNIKKGLDLLLPAFRDYCRRHSDAVLVLAGSDDGYQQEAQQFISRNGLEKQIRLVGMLTGETKLAALADADVFVLPSYSEGLSMAVLEAMAAGVPALISDRVGLGRRVGQIQAACLTDLNPESIAQNLDTVLHNATLAETLKNNARQLVQNQYDINVVGSQLLQEYKNLVFSSHQRSESHPA